MVVGVGGPQVAAREGKIVAAMGGSRGGGVGAWKNDSLDRQSNGNTDGM